MKKRIVAVGMSGGVDSSVAALLLKQSGYEVFGLFMKNWEESDKMGQCLATQDYEDALAVCQHLDIPLYTVNFTQEYYDLVFNDLLQGLAKGYTPNPDILCNREIKFKLFLQKALALGADMLATGHYCQILQEGDSYSLVKGKDPSKDQSYFVYTLHEKELSNVCFPVGNLLKSEVRSLAKAHGLPTFAKKDSTGICFIGKRNFQPFIAKYLPTEKGPIVSVDGKVLGTHIGAFYYTIGQRKGLGIGGEGEAWFVVDKIIPTNTVVVAQGESHPALFSNSLQAHQLSWVGATPQNLPLHCFAKIRYRQNDQSCVIENLDNKVAQIRFLSPQRAATPGQSIVFYQGDICLGGGVLIKRTHNNKAAARTSRSS